VAESRSVLPAPLICKGAGRDLTVSEREMPISQVILASRTLSHASFISPQGRLTAIVLASGKEKGSEEAESRVEIRDRGGAVLCVHDFSSSDGEHGYGVDAADWTPDSQFFVLRMRNSGGHMPLYAPVVFWSRSRNHFYQLDDYAADQIFSITSPAKVSVETWPNMKSATVSLGDLGTVKATELRSENMPTFDIRRPTVVALFPPVTQSELSKDADTNEALADFQVYATQVKEPLEEVGVDFKEVHVHGFRVRLGKTVTTFRPVKAEVGYYFVAPGKKPRIEYGVMTDVGLSQVASEYFGAIQRLDQGP
jgi:hypothetical protein